MCVLLYLVIQTFLLLCQLLSAQLAIWQENSPRLFGTVPPVARLLWKVSVFFVVKKHC